jgi:hypothetical protein
MEQKREHRGDEDFAGTATEEKRANSIVRRLFARSDIVCHLLRELPLFSRSCSMVKACRVEADLDIVDQEVAQMVISTRLQRNLLPPCCFLVHQFLLSGW